MSETTTTETPIIIDTDYEQSPQLEKFAEALAAAQGEIDNADKDMENTHFGSRYADLAAVINAIRGPLSAHKIARLQTPRTKATGEIGIRTALIHTSGQFIAFTFWCKPERTGPQALGSVLTYLRRYGLAAAVGVGQEDDDGNAGQGNAAKPPQPVQKPNGASSQKPVPAANGNGAKGSAPPAASAPADAEHEANLKKIRDCVGNELKWDRKTAVSFLRECFGVESTDKLTKAQAPICLQLVIAGVDGEEAYKAAKLKALADHPEVFA
jgi:hypothetical protein